MANLVLPLLTCRSLVVQYLFS